MIDNYYININNQSYKYIENWINYVKFNKKKKKSEKYKHSLLITGPCGISKTTYLNILLKKYDYTIFEFNVIDFKNHDSIKTQINNILHYQDISSLFTNKKEYKAIIINQIDQFNTTEKNILQIITKYIQVFNNNIKKINSSNISQQTKIKQIRKKNIIPIIFVANEYKNSFKSIHKYSQYLKFSSPSDYEIMSFSKYYIKLNNISISEINLIRIIHMFPPNFKIISNNLDLIDIYLHIHKKFNLIPIQQIIFNNKKDLDIDIYQSTYSLLSEPHTFELCGNIMSKDSKYILLLLYKNFIYYLHHNTQNTFTTKLETMLYFNQYVNFSSNILYYYFNVTNVFLFNYINYTISNYVNNSLNNKTTSLHYNQYSEINKSPIISKLNYKFCNLKYIRILSNKLHINEYSFQICSHYLHYLFSKHKFKKYQIILINIIKKYDLTIKDLEKIFNLNYINKIKKTTLNYGKIYKLLFKDLL